MRHRPAAQGVHVRSAAAVQRGDAEPEERGGGAGDGEGVAAVAEELRAEEAAQCGVLDDGVGFVGREWRRGE